MAVPAGHRRPLDPPDRLTTRDRARHWRAHPEDTMTESRIGDTVHYWRRTSADPGTCIAAIITGHGDRDGQLALALIHPGAPALHHREAVNYDTDGALIDRDGDTYAGFGGFTPGTWHNLH